jgi:hypothetical protein
MEARNRSVLSSSRTRRVALGVASGLAVAVLILLVTPNTLGAASAQAIVLSAPYKGTSTGYSNGWSVTGCGKAMISAPPFFDPHTGAAGFADRAVAPTCKSNPVNPSASAGSGFLTLVPVHISGTSVSIVAVTTMVASVRANVGSGTCAGTGNYSCYQSSYAELFGEVYLLDQTSGLYWYPSTFWYGAFVSAYNDTFCYLGTCSYFSSPSASAPVSTTFVWQVAATSLNPADHFQLVVYFWGEVEAYQSVFGATLTGGLASASVNMATMGNGFDLDSITIV